MLACTRRDYDALMAGRGYLNIDLEVEKMVYRVQEDREGQKQGTVDSRSIALCSSDGSPPSATRQSAQAAISSATVDVHRHVRLLHVYNYAE